MHKPKEKVKQIQKGSGGDKIVPRKPLQKNKEVLGYEPRDKMRKGIKKTYGWIIENLGKVEAAPSFRVVDCLNSLLATA